MGFIETSNFALLQKAGDKDSGCLQNLTVDNRVSDFSFTPHDERLFLLVFYQATGGPSDWLKRKGWRNDSAIHHDHCKWFGIECYQNSSYIKRIDLTGNNVQSRPPNFWRFRNLQGLCLSHNKKMTGSIADITSANMTRLRRLSVSFTEIYGVVPWSILLQLRNLEKLQICCTQRKMLGGSLPHDIGRLEKLQVLSIGETRIHGDLPLSIAKLTKLWLLDLEYVKLNSGELWYFSNMSNLQYLHLSNCGLKGVIPNDFGRNHPNMIELRLYGNELRGELNEHCFIGFQKITQLSLASNHLRGLLPTSLGNLDTLEVLDLSNNNFTGFAENMTFSKHLQSIFIGGNVNLNVEVNHLLKALQPCRITLRMLVAKNCGLRNSISIQLWDFQQILFIDLSANNLTGSIPSNARFSMAYLFYLTLASNNFTGELQVSFFSPLNSLTFLDVRDNRHLKSKGSLSNVYLEPMYAETLNYEGKFSCPTLRLTITGGRAELDPGYYHYSLCYCNPGCYGHGNYCKPCMDGASCEEKNTSPVNRLDTKMTINKGYWPCCGDFENVTRMVKCSQEEIFDDEICAPSGNCSCELKFVNGQLKTFCDKSCICRHGNKGRFCSQCVDGYYKKGSLCISCPEFRKNFPVVLIVSFVLCFLVSIALLVCLRYRKRVVLFFMFILAVTLIVLHFVSIIPGWFFVVIFSVWIFGLSGAGENLGSFLSIAVFFFPVPRCNAFRRKCVANNNTSFKIQNN